jgi:hypothetical protein
MQRTISWNLPTTYTDNTSIDSADVSKIIVHIFKDNQEVFLTLPGVTTFPIEVVRGETNAWQLTAELNGMQSPKSPTYNYTEPFQIPMAPIIGSIS